ncbi:kinesin-like protein klp-3 [Brachyhypopomus gauderio]|uniref:kinesin-like protein klp-3 n=1 Tax=Brachyhypopomus gauderio TaxID=698409 RepID=UPI0040436AA6
MGSGASVGRETRDTLHLEKVIYSRGTATPSAPTLAEDGWPRGDYVQGKGGMKICMFEERISICRYFDAQSGMWLLLPLHWEMDTDFVRHKVQQVMEALPGLVDQKEVAADLRQCNYDVDQVITMYLTIFGDTVSQPHEETLLLPELNSFRGRYEKKQIVEDLKEKLQFKEKEAEDLLKTNSRLTQESQHLSDVLQNLTRRLVEQEADKQVVMEKLRTLLSHPTEPPGKASVDPHDLRKVRREARELSTSAKLLRSAVSRTLTDVRDQLRDFSAKAELMSQRERQAQVEVEEMRSLYHKEVLERKAQYNKLLEVQGNIRVFCRCRGPGGLAGVSGCLDVPSEHELQLLHRGAKKKFHFDKVFSSTASQEQVFNGALPFIASCLEGFNICVLSYGQSGSGKTYTMVGPKNQPGLNIRSVRELLRLCKERENITYTLKVSMLEIYVESLYDLLSGNPQNEVEIRTQGTSVTVPSLTQVEVKTDEDIVNVMETGGKNLYITSDKTDVESSCSHLIVFVTVEVTDGVCGFSTQGTLTLCDLAGSERVSKTQVRGQQLTETAAVNKSLMALRQVLSALKSNTLHVPFRNSKLTHLLQPSLSGEARACVFVHVRPELRNIAETLNTLMFGSSLRQIALGNAPQKKSPTKTSRTEK